MLSKHTIKTNETMTTLIKTHINTFSRMILGRLKFHCDNDEYENEFLCAGIIISYVLPGFIFVFILVDDEMKATSRSSRCLQKRNENDSDI